VTDEGRCTGCGARMQAADGACPYCGASAATPAAAAATPDPAAEREAALAAVRSHPSFEALARDVPAVPAVVRVFFVLPFVVGTVFAASGTGFALVWLRAFTGRSESAFFGRGIALVGPAFAALFCLVGVGIVVGAFRTRRRLLGGPVRAAPAVVLAKRTEPGKNATSYYLTLGFEGGDRHEFGTLDSVFRSAFEGDAGVAHCRGELLLGFRKVDGASGARGT
jgi:hypothetical protein